jgi:hypothetical protein
VCAFSVGRCRVLQSVLRDGGCRAAPISIPRPTNLQNLANRPRASANATASWSAERRQEFSFVSRRRRQPHQHTNGNSTLHPLKSGKAKVRDSAARRPYLHWSGERVAHAWQGGRGHEEGRKNRGKPQCPTAGLVGPQRHVLAGSSRLFPACSLSFSPLRPSFLLCVKTQGSLSSGRNREIIGIFHAKVAKVAKGGRSNGLQAEVEHLGAARHRSRSLISALLSAPLGRPIIAFRSIETPRRSSERGIPWSESP